MKVKRHDLPARMFPIRVEALNPTTREVVWSAVIEKPAGDRGTTRLEIPPLKRQLGHPVAMRMTFGDGSVKEDEPSITCPRCKRTSYNTTDIMKEYCGACHQFHYEMMV